MPHHPRLVPTFVLMMIIGTVSAAPPQVLSITATCRDNEKCIFGNAWMEIDLTLTNNARTSFRIIGRDRAELDDK